jgi:hypothetical protein
VRNTHLIRNLTMLFQNYICIEGAKEVNIY